MRSAAARRRVAIALLCAVPLALALAALAARVGGIWAGALVAACAAVVLGGLARRAWRIDAAWLARRLDAASPCMDDSAALLFAESAQLSNLERLQQARLRSRLTDLDVDLRPPWPRRAIAASACAALALFVVAALWTSPPRLAPATEPAARTAATASATTLAQVELAIAPPAYTGLPARREASLEAKAPEGARLRWRLRFAPQPTAAALVLHDGHRLALARDGDDWSGEHTLTASTLYRVALDGAPALADDRLFRLDARADQPPELRVLAPEHTLSLFEPGQQSWTFAAEASDDYGLGAAELLLTLTQGTGENIAFKEQTIALAGEPLDGPRRIRYRHTLDLGALGLAQGGDVIVRLVVHDNRQPKPNTTRSASFILRWPAEPSSDSAGLEGIVQKTLPAYFRSQRQIIIDSEALLTERATLDEAKFLARSDAIGVDQKILRLRYGQFLGEESEGHGGGHGHADDAAHADDDGHDHSAHDDAAPAPTGFGQAGDVVAEYGHVHDIAEAATLLDADIRAILKSALAEMWQAELHLRQGHPDLALPYEQRALEFVKQVQQSTRIYLARVGLELPAPDETRRLSGERKDLIDRVGSLTAAADDERTIAQLWQALADGGTPDWAAATSWLRAHQARTPDALGVLAALDAAQRDPACADCRARLRDLLWPLLPTPAAATAPRAAPDAAGRAYLDALREAAKGAG
ncbi:MAG: DUF4175 domain-containing protein [Rhodanobacteraceae bacterium]|nr:DUF4175 domain-containing protein [Rhodanobacteraceae bacterium]